MPRKGGLDTEAIRQMVEEDGLSIAEVSMKLGKEYSTIWKHAKDHGIAFSTRGKTAIVRIPLPVTPLSQSALRLAVFDPCVRRALRVRMGEDLKLPGARDFGFGPAFYALVKATRRLRKKSEERSIVPPPSEVP